MNNDLKRHADVIVETCVNDYIDGNNFAFLAPIFGRAQFAIKATPDSEQNYYILLEALYDYYRKHPHIPVHEMFLESLNTYAAAAANLYCLNYCMNYIYAQLGNEQKGLSPFEMDFRPTLEILKNNVLTNQCHQNDPRISEWIEETNSILKDKYGHMTL